MLKDYSLQLGKKLVVKENDYLTQIALEDISHIIANVNGTIIVLNSWQKYSCDKNIHDLNNLLKNYKFIQINKKIIINKQNIVRIHNNSINNTIIMRNQETFRLNNKNEVFLHIAS